MRAPDHMSPEQVERPAEVGPPSDASALGAVLATATQGRYPWTGPTGPDEQIRPVLQRTVTGRPDLLRADTLRCFGDHRCLATISFVRRAIEERP